MPRKHLLILLLSLAATFPLRAQDDDDDPAPTNGPLALPYAAAPGAATALTIYGSAGAPVSLWTNIPGAEASTPTQDAKKLHASLTVPANTPVGVYALRLLTTTGAAPLQLFMVDDLPTVTRRGKNTSPASPQPITFPCAIDGAVERINADYYRVALKKGQRLSVEAVAHRLGSRLDPVLRLLDATGREIAYADDAPGGGGDGRFSLTVPADGDYLLELRDGNYEGGGEYRYHLRVGDFPMAVGAYPHAFKRGATTRVSIEGPAVEGIKPADVAFPADAARRPFSFKFDGGQSSGFVSLFAGELETIAASKKQLTGPDPIKLTPPVAIVGRFNKPGARDYYCFDAKKGDRFTFHIKTRLFGSPCDPMLRVLDAKGAFITQLKITSVVVADERKGPPPPPPVDDESLDLTIPADGLYKFSMEDINRSGAPGLVYHVVVERTRPGFALLIDADSVVAAANGVAKLKVKCTRRDYKGPIALSLIGAPEGIELKNATIAEGKTEADVELKLPPDVKPGLLNVYVKGAAKTDGSDFTATASTRTALRRQFPRLPNPPAELDGLIAIGVTPAKP